MKILYTYSFTTDVYVQYVCVEGVSQLTLSAVEGGVNKGIVCLFFGDGRAVEELQKESFVCSVERWMQIERNTYLLDSAAEGNLGRSGCLLRLLQRSYSDVFVVSGAITVYVPEEARDRLFICLEDAAGAAAEEEAGRWWSDTRTACGGLFS